MPSLLQPNPSLFLSLFSQLFNVSQQPPYVFFCTMIKRSGDFAAAAPKERVMEKKKEAVAE